MEKPVCGACGKGVQVTLPAVNMLWIGPSLGRLEQLSIKSFLAAGHEVRLHTYGHVDGVPSGVTKSDASSLLPPPEAESLRHRQTGSFALASDLFRYRLMLAGQGLWSDIDVVCLRPLTISGRHLFGWENKRRINGAILYLPPDSRVLADVMQAFRPGVIPPWLSMKRKAPLYWRRIRGQKFGPQDLPWGSFGPRALTYLARRHGVDGEARPQDAFYPVPLRDAQRVFDADFGAQDFAVSGSLAVHLWNERLKGMRDRQPEPGSLLESWYRKFDV
jgi:Alpha 1,4-glycosyltransferase conserved region